MGEFGYLLIANSGAGTADKHAVEEAAQVLGAETDLETIWTTSTTDLDRALAGLDGRTVVVAGGDGSIHLLVNQLDRAGLLDSTPVGILPLGTGNDLARGLGIPFDPVQASSRILARRLCPISLIRLSTGEVATNNLHLGLGVAAAQRAASLKRMLGRFAFTVGGIIAGISHGSSPMSVAVDGNLLHDGAAAMVLVALGPSAGGGYELADDIDARDAELEVFVVTANRLTARLRLLRHLAANDIRASPSVSTRRGSEISIIVPGATTAEVDGEFRTWSGTITMTVEPHAWNVIV